jgi:hypothetical protein
MCDERRAARSSVSPREPQCEEDRSHEIAARRGRDGCVNVMLGIHMGYEGYEHAGKVVQWGQ